MAEIPYRIRRSDRARRVRVSVSGPGEVEVVIPRRATERDAESAVRELRPWIERRLRDAARAHSERLLEPGTVPYLDERLVLVAERGRTRVARRGERLLVPRGDPREALERWYRARARAEIGPRLDRACEEAGVAYSRLVIRAQRTRWASCAPSGTMSFNWRLLLAPEAVLDTVVWHEVCHLTIADHSKRFRALLSRYRPDHREQEGWLRRYGSTLTLDALALEPFEPVVQRLF
jgi:predicted metal-dependent hydrolase